MTTWFHTLMFGDSHHALPCGWIWLKIDTTHHLFLLCTADFGLSIKMAEHQTHVSNRHQGTYGYVAPEVSTLGKVTKLADGMQDRFLIGLLQGKSPRHNPMKGQGWSSTCSH